VCGEGVGQVGVFVRQAARAWGKGKRLVFCELTANHNGFVVGSVAESCVLDACGEGHQPSSSCLDAASIGFLTKSET
jgi:hypothetical protein